MKSDDTTSTPRDVWILPIRIVVDDERLTDGTSAVPIVDVVAKEGWPKGVEAGVKYRLTRIR